MTLNSDVRAKLRELLREKAILHSTDAEPITHRNGAVAPWAFYSWNVSLSEHGLRLASHGLLDALSTFKSTQLASYGFTGLPLLAACVLEGKGAYTGLSIREKRKPYLTRRRIDGNIDRSKPVVIIDDSLSSGTSMHKAVRALEEEGLEVEGTIALVHFPYRGAKEWANAAGYRTVTLFDIWNDLEMADTSANYAGAYRDRGALLQPPMPERMTPAALARETARRFLESGQIPQWPAHLDTEYNARGGTFVSIRRRNDDHRIARDGFWHFDPDNALPARDVVLATCDTLTRSPHGLTERDLPSVKFGVTFFTELEQVEPVDLDFDRYGIVVRSNVWPDKLGGALPNTQVYISDIEQYRHARKNNARIDASEPHSLFRHLLSKHTEAGDSWLPYGIEEDARTSWWRDERIGQSLASMARETIRSIGPNDGVQYDTRATLSVAQSSLALPPVATEGVAVTLYDHGLAGYGISYDTDAAHAVRAAATAAWNDKRFLGQRIHDIDATTVVISVLHHGEDLGSSERSLVERKVRRGLDAVTLAQDEHRYTVLPSALVYNNFSRSEFLDVLQSAAGGGRVQTWRTHQVAAWASEPQHSASAAHNQGRAHALRFAFPVIAPTPCESADVAGFIDTLAGFILRSLDANGIPAYGLAPNDSDYVRHGTAGRVMHALYALRIAGDLRGRDDWRSAAAQGVAYCLRNTVQGTIALPHHVGGPLADAVLLRAATACALTDDAACVALYERLSAMIHESGWIGAGQKSLENPQDQEFLPGAIVFGIANYCRETGRTLPATIGAARCHYTHRFREFPTWGSPWLAEGFGALYDITGEARDADLAYAVADWVGERQLTRNGAFLEDMSPDEPSFNAGFVAEGVAAAWRVAEQRGDGVRAKRYGASWRRALGFVRTLTLNVDAVFPYRSPERALGGVRCTIARSAIRIDQVSHALHALVSGP
jgi:orotate phosphoribosyltransferase/AMMECR1 domain-containing protein